MNNEDQRNPRREMTLAEKFGFEEERLTYEEVKKLQSEIEEMGPVKIGKYGRMWARYMAEEYPVRKAYLLTEGLWLATMEKVQQEAMDMLISLKAQYMKKMKRPTDSYLEIVKYEYQMLAWAEEIVVRGIVHRKR